MLVWVARVVGWEKLEIFCLDVFGVHQDLLVCLVCCVGYSGVNALHVSGEWNCCGALWFQVSTCKVVMSWCLFCSREAQSHPRHAAVSIPLWWFSWWEEVQRKERCWSTFDTAASPASIRNKRKEVLNIYIYIPLLFKVNLPTQFCIGFLRY